MRSKMLVVGGYGKVGRVICTALGAGFPGRVIAAGRDFGKAEKLSVETGGRILPLELDVRSARTFGCLDSDVKIVVMCIDQCNTDFVRMCFNRGIHYVDISASYDILSGIESLDDEAKRHGSTAVLSVGLAPGLTNLLVSYNKSLLPEMDRADIFIMLGLGEAHGEAAIRWTVENLNSEFFIREGGTTRKVRCFEGRKQTVFPGNIGRRTAFRFNFPEQKILPKTLGLDSVATWLCFDSALVTWALAICAKAGVFGILRFPSLRELLIRLFKAVHFGSNGFVVKAESQRRTVQPCARNESSFAGQEEAVVTGLVAAEIVGRLYTTSYPGGVFHMEQLFAPRDIIEKLQSRGFRFVG